MIINELKLNNILQYKDDFRVRKQLRGKYFYVGVNLFNYISKGNNLDLISPVFVTPKILSKCGFKQVGKKTYCHEKLGGNTGIYFEMDLTELNSSIISSVKGGFDEEVTFKVPLYLHQLQNLYFCLTNEELIKDLKSFSI